MLSDNQKQQILAMYATGEKIEVIALIVGCRSDEVSTTANKSGMRRLTRCNNMEKRDSDILRERAKGARVSEIAKQYKLDASYIYRIIKRQAKMRAKRINELDICTGYAAWQGSIEQLANKLMVSESTIYRVLEKNGIDRCRKYRRYAGLEVLM